MSEKLGLTRHLIYSGLLLLLLFFTLHILFENSKIGKLCRTFILQRLNAVKPHILFNIINYIAKWNREGEIWNTIIFPRKEEIYFEQLYMSFTQMSLLPKKGIPLFRFVCVLLLKKCKYGEVGLGSGCSLVIA